MQVQVPASAEEACQIYEYDPTTKLIILRRSPKTYKYKHRKKQEKKKKKISRFRNKGSGYISGGGGGFA